MSEGSGKPTLDDLARDEPLWFVCSYPKSGNTWVRALLYHYALEAGISRRLTRANDLDRYSYEAVSLRPVSQLTPSQLIQLRGAVLMHLRRREAGPLVVKSHYLNGSMGGVPMFSPIWCDKVIHVVRDPREIAPSFADHMGQSVDDAIELMGEPTGQLMGEFAMSHYLHTWSVHTESWLEADNVPIHTVTYAGLHRDTAGELRKMVEFLGLEVDEDALAFAVEQSDFEVMREIEEEGGFREASSQQERFFRRGKAGAWREELTTEQAARIEREHGPVLSKLRQMGGVAEEPMGATA